jgi:hypothetical protein
MIRSPEVIFPTWPDFDEVVKFASRDLLICCPFYSVEGLTHIKEHLEGTPAVRFRIRLSPSDWAAGVSDPQALLALITFLRKRSCQVDIGVNQRLHAKAYAADKALLLLGSSNLTAGGFGNNVELMMRLRGDDASTNLLSLSRGLRKHLKTLTVTQLSAWVKHAAPIVATVRELDREDEQVTAMLAPVQSQLDGLLGYGKGDVRSLPNPDEHDLAAFVTWLQEHPTLAGATMLLRYKVDNLQRNSGKFNQAFYGAFRFLSEQPKFIKRLTKALERLDQDDIYPFDDPDVVEAWTQHLDAHARDRTPHFSYPTLRGYLTPQLGGTLTGGGGGGTTLKRILPVVAQFLKARQ